MKLAEALSMRADLQKNISQLTYRLKDSSKIQEGDEPAEKIEDLMAELDDALVRLENLIYWINETNSRTMYKGENITRMMARKDVLSKRVDVMREVLRHVTENETRYGRSEVRFVRMVDVAGLRKETDNYARQLRELDMEIQSLNWQTELVGSL